MQPETVGGLKGTPGSELDDLRKVMMVYQGWHLNHYPYYTFDLFADKVKKFGKTGPQRNDVNAYMQKLRAHYKGEEFLEELREVPKVAPGKEGAGEVLMGS